MRVTLSSMSFRSASLARRAPRRLRDAHDARRLFLVPSGEGWSLVDHDGATIVRGTGVSSRRRCLEYAQANGILAVLP